MQTQDGRYTVAAGAALFALTFALSSFSVDLGMGSVLTMSFADIVLHPSARFFKFPWNVVCFVVPVAAAQLLFGNPYTAPRIIVVRLVCVIAVSAMYKGLPEAEKSRSILPFLAHGFWLVLGETLYCAMVSGLLQMPIGFLIAVVEWVVAGGLSVLFMRLLARTAFQIERGEEDE